MRIFADERFGQVRLARQLGHHLVHQRRLAGTWLMVGRVDHERGAEYWRLVVVSHGSIP